MNKCNGNWLSTTELVANINNSCAHFTGIDLSILPENRHNNCLHLRSRNIFEYVLKRPYRHSMGKRNMSLSDGSCYIINDEHRCCSKCIGYTFSYRHLSSIANPEVNNSGFRVDLRKWTLDK